MEVFSKYFDAELSMKKSAVPLREALRTVADRYIAENPIRSFSFRPYRSDGFLPDAEGWHTFDLNTRYPEAGLGQGAFVAADFYLKAPEELTIRLRCFSKTEVFINGAKVWSSTTMGELDDTNENFVTLPCTEGRNSLAISCKKTMIGFGCAVSPAEPFWRWLIFYAPFDERKGQGGFIYSSLFSYSDLDPSAAALTGSESDNPLRWYPDLSEGEVKDPFDLEEVFGCAPGSWACIWTKLDQHFNESRTVNFTVSDGAELFVDGTEVVNGSAELSGGVHDALLVSRCPENARWRTAFSAAYEDGKLLEASNPGVTDYSGAYLYLGSFDKKPDFTVPELHRLYGDSEKCYWRINKYTAVRPYLEQTCFGKFSYPLGVTLYGLTQTSRILDRRDILDYVKSHIRECVSMHEYSIWDRETFGYPEINNQIVTLGCLDACGSFGSAIMEAFGGEMDECIGKTVGIIASYMENTQARLDDGAFYRPKGLHPTMWADDQYMSIPFLCRYWRASGDPGYLEDAIKQVFLFKKHLYIPKKKVLSHVLDFKIGKPTLIPWGRGNGWTLFSITELLEYMPADHEARNAVLEYFRELCEGYLALQGSRGLWHQVLTMPDTYEEASCTAMFIYSFCRAVRFGWVDEELGKKLFSAAVKGWDGLESCAIDRDGNIYGICRGSLYSYDPDYYKAILGWSKNDTHGIGIVLLAGIELSKLSDMNTKKLLEACYE